MVIIIKDYCRKHRKWLVPLVFILSSILSVAYLWHFGYVYYNTDFMYHLYRIRALKLNMISGRFPLINWGTSVPYGTALTYYPWLTLLPFALLDMVVQNTVNFFYITIMLIFLIGYLISYYSAHKVDKSWLHDFIFAIFYVNSSILFDFAFRSGDIATVLASMFLSMALFGLIDLMKNNCGWFMMTCGLILAICTHLLTGIFAIVTLVIIALLNIKRFKLTGILKAVLGAIVGLIVTAIFWVPDFILFAKNKVTSPAVYSTLSSGLLHYIGSTCNYVYCLIDIIGLLAIICIGCKKFHWFDFTVWLSGLFLILLNTHFMSNLMVYYMPFMLHLQFTYRFGVISHLLLCYLGWKLLTGMYDKNCHHFELLFVTAFILFTPLFDEINQHFLLNSRPVLTMHLNNYMNSTHNKIRKYHIKFNHELKLDYQTKENETSYRQFRHYVYNYDYSPNKSVAQYQAGDQSHLSQVYSKTGKWQGTEKYIPTDKGIILNHDYRSNIQFPIVIYHGIKYEFTLNGRIMNNRYINYKLTDKTSELVLHNLPKGRIKIGLRNSELNI